MVSTLPRKNSILIVRLILRSHMTCSPGKFFIPTHRCASSLTKKPINSQYLTHSNSAINVSSVLLTHRRFYAAELPEHIKIKLPALSPTMESGTITSWQKKEGDQLSEGDLLCEIETDKATMGFETPEEGYLAKILIPEGTKDVPIGKLLCIIVQNAEDVSAFKDFKPADDSAQASAASASIPTKPADSATPTMEEPKSQPASPLLSPNLPPIHTDHRIKASPYAQKLASEKGIDLSHLSGSGPSGRILATDVLQVGPGKPPSVSVSSPGGLSADFTDITLSNMRRTIAKRLSESKSSIPHYYLTSECHIDALLGIRKKLNAILEKMAKNNNIEKAQKLSINDFIIKASALACLRVPAANSFWMDTFIRQNNGVDVSVAVSTDVGLITPIIFSAHAKGLATINSEMANLAAKAREGRLQPHEFQGGTFTVSNLGMYGSVDHFTAIINPPQSCILAIGAAKRKVIPAEENNEEHSVVTALSVTLSCDHRVVDGAVGAVWLQHFKRFIEQPTTMLL